MDYLESVMPDGEKILREAAIDVEQETGFVKYDKKQIIFEYCLYTIMNLKKPCYPYVVTNYEYSEDFIEYYVEDLPIKVNLIIFDKKGAVNNLCLFRKLSYTQFAYRYF